MRTVACTCTFRNRNKVPHKLHKTDRREEDQRDRAPLKRHSAEHPERKQVGMAWQPSLRVTCSVNSDSATNRLTLHKKKLPATTVQLPSGWTSNKVLIKDCNWNALTGQNTKRTARVTSNKADRWQSLVTRYGPDILKTRNLAHYPQTLQKDRPIVITGVHEARAPGICGPSVWNWMTTIVRGLLDFWRICALLH